MFSYPNQKKIVNFNIESCILNVDKKFYDV